MSLSSLPAQMSFTVMEEGFGSTVLNLQEVSPVGATSSRPYLFFSEQVL